MATVGGFRVTSASAPAGRLGGWGGCSALPAVQVLVLMVQGETGHLPLQVSKLWLHCHVGAEEEAAQDVPAEKSHRRGTCLRRKRPRIGRVLENWCDSRLVALQPASAFGTWTTVAFLRPLRIQLLITKSVG